MNLSRGYLKMKTKTRILFAFLLNLLFSAVELVGGYLTGSVAILSDALHDAGDALGIGVAFVLETVSGRCPDRRYTYGYLRYSVLGGLLTALLLAVGAVAVVWQAAMRLIHPVPIAYDGMIWLAAVGVIINLAATLLTAGGGSLNQRAVSLHMLEDVLGWVAVLIGAVVMKLTGWVLLDTWLSIALSLVLLAVSVRTAGEALAVLLDRAPDGVCTEALARELAEIEGVCGVHHLHLRSLDGERHEASVHLVCAGDTRWVREAAESLLRAHGAVCVTVQVEEADEACPHRECTPPPAETHGHHHHGHRHH